MLERETKREKNLETRAKELKIKAKKDQAKTETVTEAESVDDVLKRVRIPLLDQTVPSSGQHDASYFALVDPSICQRGQVEGLEIISGELGSRRIRRRLCAAPWCICQH